MAQEKKSYKRQKKENRSFKYITVAGATAAIVAVVAIVGGMVGSRMNDGAARMKIETVSAALETTPAP